MTDPYKAMQQAIDALYTAQVLIGDWASYASPYFQEKDDLAGNIASLDVPITALRAALAAKPEPVAWMDLHGNLDHGLDAILDPKGWTPLFAAPPAPCKWPLCQTKESQDKLAADRDMLRDALAAMVAAHDSDGLKLWHALEDARQALAQAGGPNVRANRPDTAAQE